MPWLLFDALVKIIEPIEGAKAAQMGLMDTHCKEMPKYLEKGLKLPYSMAFGDAAEKRLKSNKKYC